MSVTGPVPAPGSAPPSIALEQEVTQTSSVDFEENMYSEVNPNRSSFTDASTAAAAAHPLPPPSQSQMSDSVAASGAAGPPVPASRGPGHTPRSQGLEDSLPPQRPPSRTSSRFNTPRHNTEFDVTPAHTAAAFVADSRDPPAAEVVRPSVAQSENTVQYAVEDEVPTETGSISFRVEPSQRTNRRGDTHVVVEEPSGARGRSASSAAPTMFTVASDIHFTVDDAPHSSQTPEHPGGGGGTQAQQRNAVSLDPVTFTEASDIQFHFDESQRGSHVPPAEPQQRASLTSVQFEVESTNEHTGPSSMSRFSAAGEGPASRPVVPITRMSIDREDDVEAAGGAPNSTAKVTEEEQQQQEEEEIQFVTASEERRREKAAAADWRKKALQTRSDYMNSRPWEANEAKPGARLTSSQSAARSLKQRETEKMEEVEKRKRSMHQRPWRTNSESPNLSRRPSAPAANVPTPRKPPVPRTPTKKRSNSTSSGKAKLSARTAAASARATKRSAEDEEAEAVPQESTPMPTPRAHSRLSAPLTHRSTPSAPPKPVFDAVEAAKFVSPAPVLKAPLDLVSDELEAWTQTVSQHSNLQAITEVMRARERVIVRLSNQLNAQGRVMARLNKELYSLRDEYVRQYGLDVSGMPLRAPHFPTPSPARVSGSRPANTVRLYPEPRHQAKDYYTMKLEKEAQSRASVLSDGELSEGERDGNAAELVKWRRDRAAMRAEKHRLAQRRRDLAYQMHRGSNIKDISLLRPTSARGPLERAACGTETAVDVDGYDKLMELRMDAQRAEVEAANAAKVHESTVTMTAAIKKEHDPASPAAQAAKERRRSAKEMYTAALRHMRQTAQNARSLLERAGGEKTRLERRAAASVELGEEAALQGFSDAVQAVRLKLSSIDALATAAGEEEELMLRSTSTPRVGTSRATTPRGSMGGAARPGRSTSNDAVFRRLTARKVYSSTPSVAVESTSAAP